MLAVILPSLEILLRDQRNSTVRARLNMSKAAEQE